MNASSSSPPVRELEPIIHDILSIRASILSPEPFSTRECLGILKIPLTWDYTVLREPFSTRECLEILKIPLNCVESDIEMGWYYSKDGTPTVKSVYFMLMK